MPSYEIPSSPVVPEGFNVVDHSVDEEASIAGLAKRVSAYLARVVGALADFEDRLLTEDGFFAREEHFEAQIDSLRREFEMNKRAAVCAPSHDPFPTALLSCHRGVPSWSQALFQRSDAVGLLIAQLVANTSNAGAELHSRRQHQFVFAASVLLTSSTILRTLREQPALLDRLWAFVLKPAPLDPVQLQYWCRVAGSLLLRDGAPGNPHHPTTVAAIAPLLPKLLRHVYSDSVCLLIKCLLGLPMGALSREAESNSSSGGANAPGGTMSMRSAIAGEHSILPPCVETVLCGGKGAANAAELLCTLCHCLPDRPDALELRAVFVPTILPMLTRLLDAGLADKEVGAGAPVPLEARLGALKVASASLFLEHRTAQLMAESLAWLPTELLAGDSAEATSGLGVSPATPACTAPFARLLSTRLDALRQRLLHATSLQQLQVAELLSSLLQTAPAFLHSPICDARLIEAAASVFLRPDANGGGRQDFVRHILLRGMRAALDSSNGPTRLHHALIHGAELPRHMLSALTSTARSAPPKEYVRLLHLELSQAAEAEPTIDKLLASSGRAWSHIGRVLAGGAPNVPRSAPASPASSISSGGDSALPSPHGAARPPELIYDDGADDDDDDDTVVISPRVVAPPSNDDQNAPPPPPSEVTDVTDAENIDPNSPPGSKRPRPAGGARGGTPRPRTLQLDGGASPLAPSAASPFEVASGVGIASLAPPPPSSPPPAMNSPTPSRSAADEPVNHPGTPRPDALAPPPLQRQGTPRPEDNAFAPPALQRQGTPRPGGPGTPRPDAALRFVEDSTLRTSEDFSRDTPQPKLVRRQYLHRKAKQAFGPLTPGGTPDDAGADADSPRKSLLKSPLNSPIKSPSCSPSSRGKKALPSAQQVGFHVSGAADAAAASGEEEDPSIASLRSSVRSLCF